MTTATRYIGFCPICEGDFKLGNEGTALVHHGFTRPGVGYIIGDCLSVHMKPYELSDETCHEYVTLLNNRLDLDTRFLARLKAGEVTSFMVERRKANSRELELVLIATPNGYDFAHELEDRIRETEYSIKNIHRELARMDKWISAWTLKPVRTFEEELEKKKAATAVRLAERDAKRAVKAQKAAALKAKYAQWAQEKADLMTKYKAKFIALADIVETAAAKNMTADSTKREARTVAYDMKKERSKKGYLNFYARDLEIDQALITLDLAERLEDGWVSHQF